MIDTDDPDLDPSNIDALSAPELSTSNHSIDGSPQTAWGGGAWDSGVGNSGVELKCTSCHDPHGNGNYRVLRASPAGAATPVATEDIADEPTPDYDTTNFWDVTYLGSTVSRWCSTCHTRYEAATGAEDTAAPGGEDIFKYRHRSDGHGTAPTCIKCHAAHGTNAITTNGGYSESVPWPDGTPGAAENSRLLKMNNRGICQKCHDK